MTAFLQTEGVAIMVAALVQIALFVPLVYLYFAPATPGLIAAIVLYALTRSLLRYFAERARSDTRIGLYTLIQVGGPAIGLGFNAVMVPILGGHAEVALNGFSIGQGLVVVVGLTLSDFGRRRLRPHRGVLKEAASFGGPISLANCQAAIALNVPRFIVDWTLGLAAAGQFAVSYGMGCECRALP